VQAEEDEAGPRGGMAEDMEIEAQSDEEQDDRPTKIVTESIKLVVHAAIRWVAMPLRGCVRACACLEHLGADRFQGVCQDLCGCRNAEVSSSSSGSGSWQLSLYLW